jgi:hypothetical protein
MRHWTRLISESGRFIEVVAYKRWSLREVQRFLYEECDNIVLPPLFPHPQQGHLQQGLDLRGLNLNFGGVHSQQQGHIHGNLHFPFLGFFLQHSQQGLFTHAPNVTGNVTPPHPQLLQQQLEHGQPNPPQQFPQQFMQRLCFEQRFFRHRFLRQRFLRQPLSEKDS